MRKHVQKILNAQRDILSPQAIAAVQGSIDNLREAVRENVSKKDLEGQMSNLEATANKWLKTHPHPGLRENVEVFLVAIAVAMGIRTFFLQPFKIPTGSMQPTLFGITSNPDFSRNAGFARDLAPERDFPFPNPLSRFAHYWVSGIQYKQEVSGTEGSLTSWDEKPSHFLLFNLRQRFTIGDETHTIWFPPDNLLKRVGLLNYFGQPNPKVFKPGENIFKIKVVAGDHLFVDRLTYNFRRPKRGEIIVFETRGISALPQDQFYIKRMVALGDETVRIGNDRHLIINGKRLDASTRHFEHVYSFPASQPPKESTFSGHVNESVAREYGMSGLAPLFSDENTTFTVSNNHYMVMGDNTVNSSDSRSWGAFSRTNVIGKSFFVYWPIGAQNGRASRFGWGQQ